MKDNHSPHNTRSAGFPYVTPQNTFGRLLPYTMLELLQAGNYAFAEAPHQ